MADAWYADWELTIIGWDDGLARIDIILPHNNPSKVSIHTTKPLAPELANFLDKVLCELTGTVSEERKKIDGSNPATPTR